MKLIAAMVQDQDADEILGALVEIGCRATKVHTTGGFLRGSNHLILIGVDPGKVNQVVEVIRTHCRSRTHIVHPSEAPYLSSPMEVEVGGANIFVWDVEQYERL